mgnify:CR=1 FL=1
MRLTGVGKAFVTLVILGVRGFAVWHYKSDAIRESDCIDCMACETACPTKAIKINP